MDERPIISLLTDFGTSDSYVGQMKGVIASIEPNAVVIDISHEIAPQDVREGAFVLAGAVDAFPPGTVHVAVVDPGVGSDRRVVCATAGKWHFLAPDNGILSLVLEEHSIESVFEVTSVEYFRKNISDTFHGRDVFAPVAAHLAASITPEVLGPPASGLVHLGLPEPQRVSGKRIEGEVIYIDHFGNAVTNIRKIDLAGFPENCRVGVAGTAVNGVSRAYSDKPEGSKVSLVGSFGKLEIAVSGGNAAKALDISVGDRVYIEK